MTSSPSNHSTSPVNPNNPTSTHPKTIPNTLKHKDGWEKNHAPFVWRISLKASSKRMVLSYFLKAGREGVWQISMDCSTNVGPQVRRLVSWSPRGPCLFHQTRSSCYVPLSCHQLISSTIPIINNRCPEHVILKEPNRNCLLILLIYIYTYILQRECSNWRGFI